MHVGVAVELNGDLFGADTVGDLGVGGVVLVKVHKDLSILSSRFVEDVCVYMGAIICEGTSQPLYWSCGLVTCRTGEHHTRINGTWV